jgi:hypothetical protein
MEVRQGNEVFARRVVVGIVPETWSEAILGHAVILAFADASFSHADRAIELQLR